MIAPDLLKRATAAGAVSVAVVGVVTALGSGVDSEADTDLAVDDDARPEATERVRSPEAGSQPVLRRAPHPDRESRRDREAAESPRTLAERNKAAARALDQLEELEPPEERPAEREASADLGAEQVRKLRELARENARKRARLEGLKGEASADEESGVDVDVGRDRIREAVERAILRSHAGDYPTKMGGSDSTLDGRGPTVVPPGGGR